VKICEGQIYYEIDRITFYFSYNWFNTHPIMIGYGQ